MEPFHAVVLTVSLFVLTFFNPGANLFVVVANQPRIRDAGRESSPAWASATGDAFYSGLGLFGLATLITQCEAVFSLIKIGRRRLFIMVRLEQYSPPGDAANEHAPDADCRPVDIFFRRGLMTDLSNPQTVLFFISIFSVTLSAETPTWARLMAWAGIVLSSVIWRIFLSQAFSLPAVRRAYGRIQRIASRVIGAIIGMFALRLLYEGVTHR
ncbi:RhtC-like transporter [Salmonella enterica subsp. enterica serovar Typhimurium]|nr:RhtC-like transporter [Salmonella enterica subsp. enterica serovar Typhimurium]